mmetsp:Transcript_7542/g.11502  ORF Transcript_7542/g.11502 Transcript_7542/m.11502 type:complete len:212 (-) Transcript_7542:866-1501(-)
MTPSPFVSDFMSSTSTLGVSSGLSSFIIMSSFTASFISSFGGTPSVLSSCSVFLTSLSGSPDALSSFFFFVGLSYSDVGSFLSDFVSVDCLFDPVFSCESSSSSLVTTLVTVLSGFFLADVRDVNVAQCRDAISSSLINLYLSDSSFCIYSVLTRGGVSSHIFSRRSFKSVMVLKGEDFLSFSFSLSFSSSFSISFSKVSSVSCLWSHAKK